MNIIIFTDTHFGHRMLVEKGHRPLFFEEKILQSTKSLFSLKTSTDFVIHLGDVEFGKAGAEMVLEFCQKLHFPIILIRGNHDQRSPTWYREHGFSAVFDKLEGTYFGKKVIFSHEPGKDLPEDTYNIHGHWHGNDHRQTPEVMAYYTDRHIALSMEENNYQPFSLKKLLSLKK